MNEFYKPTFKLNLNKGLCFDVEQTGLSNILIDLKLKTQPDPRDISTYLLTGLSGTAAY